MAVPDVDILVVGGGIQGAGVAQAAAARGHRVLLLEKTGFAAGTSSRSSKLIHGGLRYLETFQFRLVRESLAERETLLRIAPSLVERVPFHIPVYRDSLRGPLKIRAGLSLYALLGGLGEGVRFRSVPREEWGGLDGLAADGLRAVFQYWDARTDDAALTRAVIASAVSMGAEAACPARMLSARREAEGYRVRFERGGAQEECFCRVLVNAAGPWANRVLDAVEPAPPRLEIDLVQGTHIVLEGRLEKGIYYAEAPSDRRAVFLMPWKGKVLVGTTETRFEGDPDGAAPLPHEIAYLRETARRYFPALSGPVLESFAGLRVLPRQDGSYFRRPREIVLIPDDAGRPRLVTLYGGKLTGYRATAEKVMKFAASSLPPAPREGSTALIPLEPLDPAPLARAPEPE